MSATPLADIDVVILAGGEGTRLRSLFPDRPKVLVPINGLPFLRHYLDWLRAFGARRVILALGYKAGMVRDYVRAENWAGMEVETFAETSPLGTGGAVRAALPLIRSETVLVANGDSLVRADLGEFAAFHRRKRARVSMLLTRVDQVGASGVVATDAGGAVVSFAEKPADRAAAGHINAGLYLMRREAIAEIPGEGPVSLERDVFPRLCGAGFFALQGEFSFIDIGTPDSFRRASGFFRGQTP